MTNSNINELPPIVQTTVLNAPIQKVWEAVSTAEGISAWFMPNNFKPEIGYEFEINAGPFGMSPCKVTELDPPNRLSFKWGKDWTLSFDLADLNGKTQFTLTHAGWDPNQVTEFGEPHDVVRERMAGGWAGISKKLAAIIEG
ncbi:SRPBCC family protein [Paenibacillus thermotolerans]|uniref:SRPBCC family protein n=1 Tax=Paenibacillus thermotolerans TaxID=3027807 RepID=UPI002367D035|nr:MULTISPECIES: SRPBCC domain-containing protein [unclassified Paenibacillus]